MEIREELAYARRIALSWELLAEAARRHPSGQIGHDWHHWYDSLQFAVDSERAILCNRAGRIHLMGKSGFAAWEPPPNRDGWSLVMLQGPRRSLEEIESVIGLSSPKRAPATTPRTLTYRVLAALSTLSLLRGVLLDPRPGLIYDSNDSDPGVEDEQFALFPKASVILNERGYGHRIEAAKDFWFMVPKPPGASESDEQPEPLAVLHTSGRLWTREDLEVDLVQAYDQHGSRLPPLGIMMFELVIDGSDLYPPKE